MVKQTKTEGTKIALTVRERLLMNQFYPKEANLTDQTIVRDISRKIEITQEEQKKIELKAIQNGFTWNQKKEKVAQVEFTDTEINLLKDQVARLDSEKKVTQALLELCLKIKNT